MRCFLKICVLLFMVGFGCVAWAEITPTETLRPVLLELVSVLGSENLKGDERLVERRARIMSGIKKGFAFREMSKRILGKTWRNIDENQKKEFVALMTKLLENVYIGKLEGYDNQTLKFVAESTKGDRAQVTTLVSGKNIEVPVHYVMKKMKSGWMVYDINIEGVSLVGNYQQQFKSILRKEKFAGLIKVLKEKNESFQ